jgi:threonine dehydrogenase-like Zn-dependent dehydrogenase
MIFTSKKIISKVWVLCGVTVYHTPAHRCIPVVANLVAGKLDALKVLELTIDLNNIASGYTPMDNREAIKVMVRP